MASGMRGLSRALVPAQESNLSQRRVYFLALRGQEKLDTQIRTSSIRRLMYLARCSATRIVRLRATQLEFSSVSNLHNMSLLTDVSGSGTEKSPKICNIQNLQRLSEIKHWDMQHGKKSLKRKFGATASGFLSKDFQRSDFFPRVRPITLEGSVQVRNKKIQIIGHRRIPCATVHPVLVKRHVGNVGSPRAEYYIIYTASREGGRGRGQ